MTKEEKDEIEARLRLTNENVFPFNNQHKFTEPEIQKILELLELEDDWKKQVAAKAPIVFQDDGKEYPPDSFFATDGFFPGYFEQKTKVLFIGRETRWISGSDFITSSSEYFKKENVNGSAFWRNVLYMFYGIQHEGKVEYKDIPAANEIAKKMVETNNFGFAVMQLSKYSNDSDEGSIRNVEMMNRFLEDSELDKRNFFKEELSLLDPDIIITANLWECGVNEKYLEQCFPNEKFKNWNGYNNNTAQYGDFELNGKTIKLINTYHFSARKSSYDCFYEPVMNILFPKK
jgi:hypothetical protein